MPSLALSPGLDGSKPGATTEVLSNGTTCHPSGTTDIAMLLELEDGSLHQGHSFGAEKSIAGELVFQTGMVGYPESITDPSYRGQILVMTFPLVGNYGAPSRETRDTTLDELPAYFEASRIHIAGLVVASYSGEEYSHHLATSSLGTWLKEQNVPAICGLDTRLLTKKIREKGSMLVKMRIQSEKVTNGINGHVESAELPHKVLSEGEKTRFKTVDWFNPNTRNLVADGETSRLSYDQKYSALTLWPSLYQRASPVQPTASVGLVPSFRTSSTGRLC